MTKIRHYEVGDEPIPGYRLTGFLGSGGFGDVWKAAAPGGTEVAIKIINLGMKGALKEFRSLKLVKKIQYPNLVPILAIWLKDSQGELLEEAAFEQVGAPAVTQARATISAETITLSRQAEPAELIIAMGLGHKNLADRLEECRQEGLRGIPIDELLNYMQDSARAIDYLNSPRHELGSSRAIQHCDIKPSNILIVGDAAQVCDFSLVRMVDDMRKTSTAMSPLYASPEVIDTNVPSSTTDQYSLAVSYAELRTGELPFPPGATAMTVIQSHLKGALDLSHLPPAEANIIRRATARKPTDRYSSSTEMVLALRRACSLEKPQRRKIWPWLAAGAAMALVTAAVFFWRPAPTPPPVQADPQLSLPAGFVAAPTKSLVKVHGILCPDRVFYELHGLKIPLRLVHSLKVPPFYIMENKVTHEQFATFARENPGDVSTSPDWETGPCITPADDVRDHVPAFRVSCVSAALFARWIGGELPSVDQWDAAAGRFEQVDKGNEDVKRGPFREPWNPESNTQLAVNRATLGPMPVGAATLDISDFDCHDMAGNGYEWTATPHVGSEKFSPDDPKELVSMILRGRTYQESEPLRFSGLDDPLNAVTRPCTEFDCDISFRVVISFPDLN